MYQRIQKSIDWGVKVASLAITAPATWQVASDVLDDVSLIPLRLLMQLAAVFLVEGVMLSNWLLLEYDKQATPEIKARYGITALVMYIGMLVIGWEHEGFAGIIFRVALLAALAGSGWDTYVYTWQKATERVDRSVENSGRVKRHARKLAVETAMRRNKAHAEIDALTIDRDKEQRLALVNLTHDATMGDLPNRVQVIDVTPPQVTRFETTNVTPRTAKSVTRAAPQSDITSRLLDAYRDDPNLSLRKAGAIVGVSAETVRRKLTDMKAAGVVHVNGHGVEILERNG